MIYYRCIIKVLFLGSISTVAFSGWAQTRSYIAYHKEIIRAEEHIAKNQFAESIQIYRNLSENYEHVFLKDYKVAAQLSAYTKDYDNLFYFLEKGMKKGWTLKEITKNDHLKRSKKDPRWKNLQENREIYQKTFLQSINVPLRREVREMFGMDQKRALRVALTPGKKWRANYTRRKFIPNNRTQVRRINQIIDEFGYPGEKIIGDRSWATVIISHNEHDTIYNQLRPKLYRALEKGELAPINLAIIETWRAVVDTNRQNKGFIIWNDTVNPRDAAHADSLRNTIALRNIGLNNRLIQKEKELKMKFYLSPFHGGFITVKDQ